ncbi:putative TRAP-type C4-dicarboxylate transport system, small permease component [Desulforapulum autotrophicum HRM2]|uniref:TRAP-type C4-dicarboxylate transport system, small permease component n=1 Tax=Desulforapulum autotrophicum (strain ATCC 43914 / DSM 3382 / VKM B-1955 / HRM2) TaxID=177437 RepID=C0QIC2_DESAH|nr:TRAP transporter small permease [Desulforapulum autotrophicum]ACN17866.1 putative TRAP-type C4-dicarboxylate transport system, small permease component [Desulforapulum autotrophicum HRM2]
MNILNALSNTLNTWVRHFIFGLGLAMTLIVVAQVFARYVLNSSLFWSEELARYCLVWISFLGASVAYHDRVHPGVNMFGSRLPMTMERILTTLVHLVSMGLFSIMIVHGFEFASFVRLQITPALAIPKWIIMGILPLSGVIFMVHGVRFLAQDIGKKYGPEQQDPKGKK